MNAAAPYPATDRLEDAARFGYCIPCHQCGNRVPDRDYPSCLGSGWIRPCGACLGREQRRGRFCCVCEGRLFTAGDPPCVSDGESGYAHTAYATG